MLLYVSIKGIDAMEQIETGRILRRNRKKVVDNTLKT